MYKMGYKEEYMKVGDLSATSRNVNVKVKVVSIGEERTVSSRIDDRTHRVAEALVGDETGTILMTLWDDNIDLLREKEGSTILVKNGYIGVFRNSLRLNLGRYGSIEDSSEEITEVNEENNLSEQKIETQMRFRESYGRGRRRSKRYGRSRRRSY